MMIEGQIQQQFSLTQLLTPIYRDNPYPFYHQLRTHDPIYWDNALNSWVLTSYDDVLFVLRDSRFSAEMSLVESSRLSSGQGGQTDDEQILRALDCQMVFCNPPQHTRLRKIMNHHFSASSLEVWHTYIQQTVDQWLDLLSAQKEIDLLHDFAYPALATMLSHLLGQPSQDGDLFVRWDQDLVILTEIDLHTPERVRAAQDGMIACAEYARQMIAEHRTHRRDDLVQMLISAYERGEILSEEELLGNCVMLLLTGIGTTAHLISNGLLALLQHPEQLELWRDDPSPGPAAVEELLRYNPPVQMTARTAKEDIKLRGKTIEAGQSLLLCLGAANRDPAQFADPDQLILQRQNNQHVGFAHGIHLCLGAHLARLQAQVIFPTLLRRFPHMRLTEKSMEYCPSMFFKLLPVFPLILQ